MTMHLETSLICLQSLFIVTAEVLSILSASTVSAMSVQKDALDDGTIEDSNIKSNVVIPKEYSGVVEKLVKLSTEQISENNIHQPIVLEVKEDVDLDSPNSDVQNMNRSKTWNSLKWSKTEKASRIHKTNLHSIKASAPKYMLDLYNKFSTDKYSHPMANIVRSFTNINEESSASSAVQDFSGGPGNTSRVHRMLFNVTSIGREEDIYLAELRLFTVVEADRQIHGGINRRVTISEVVITPEGRETRSELIVSKEIHGRHSGWETIPITDAVRRWIKQRSNPRGDTHMIDVRTETIEQTIDGDRRETTFAPPVIDINARPHNEEEPLLLVFSNDRRRRRVYESSELEEMLGREVNPTEQEQLQPEYDEYDEELDEDEYEQEVVAERRKRKKRSPYHDIRDLHKIATSFLTRKRRAIREVNEDPKQRLSMTDNYYHTAFAKDQANKTSKWLQINRTNVMMRSTEDRNLEEEDEEEEEEEEGEPGGRMSDFRYDGEHDRRHDKRQRVRRSRKPRPVPCQRKRMHVSFVDIYWDQWVIAPSAYEAYECTGKCYWPLGDHMTPTKHSAIQTMLNFVKPGKASPTCCVPTKLDPISLLYIDDKGIVTYKYKYDGMAVSECGCR